MEKKGKRIFIVCLVLLILALGCGGYLFGLGSALWQEGRLLRLSVSEGLGGWRRVELDETHSLRLPKKWTVLREGDTIELISEDGTAMAHGGRAFGQERPYLEEIESYYGSAVKEYEWDSQAEVNYGYNSEPVILHTILENGEKHDVFLIVFPRFTYDNEHWYWFCFHEQDGVLPAELADAMIRTAETVRN